MCFLLSLPLFRAIIRSCTKIETSMMEDAPIPPWFEYLPELVGAVITGLPTARDCARLHAVCRSWRSAMHQHGSHVRHPPPLVVLPSGRFLTSFRGRSAQWRCIASFPNNARCFGSTGSWLGLHQIDAERKRCIDVSCMILSKAQPCHVPSWIPSWALCCRVLLSAR